MLTIFHVQNVLYHFWLMFMWFSCTETYWWSVHTSSSFVITDVDIFFCVENENILFLEFQYCFWLLTDVDYFSCANVLISFSTDVYVIFLYWNILMKCMHFIFICHLLMLTYFCVKNVPEFQYCFWLFTDIDYFSCAKCSYHFQLMFMWFSCTETYSMKCTHFIFICHLLMLTYFCVVNLREFQ